MTETVLVTGCSSGIGRATAETFLDAGWTVYATARDAEEIADLGDRGCRTAELDVTDDRQAAAVVDRVFEEEGHLDCLVNNAGYGQPGPIEDVPMEKITAQFDVNTFGPLRLIRAAVPRMRERGSGTVINVTAGFDDLTIPGLGVYTASKYALESATVALRQEVSQFGVDVVYVQPGLVATDFYERAIAELGGLDRTPGYGDLYSVLDSVRAVEAGGPGINSPEEVAETIVRAATAYDPDPVYQVGIAALGSYGGRIVQGRVRDRVTRAGLRALSSDPAQRLLRRRERRGRSAKPLDRK